MERISSILAKDPTVAPSLVSRFGGIRLRLRLKLAYARVLGLSRGSYKQVWNTISTANDLAMIGVSGFAEESEFFSSGESTADAICQMIDVSPEHDVLEIGCGVGRIGRSLAGRCKSWVGADISSEMLRFARTNLESQHNVSLVELSSSSLKEIPAESFDRVYCTAVFMHLDEWDRYKYVTESFRVLKDGGRCYIDNLNLAGDIGWKVFLDMSQHEPELRPPNISKSSTAEELRIYLERAGFRDVQAFPGSHFVAATGTKQSR